VAGRQLLLRVGHSLKCNSPEGKVSGIRLIDEAKIEDLIRWDGGA
jgi:hypothetical protein